MSVLGVGLHAAKHYADALTVREAELAMMRRLGASEEAILITLGNLANTYAKMGRPEQAVQIDRDVYSGNVKLHGEESEEVLIAANNYADGLRDLRRFKEAKSLLRRLLPVARRVLGESHELTFKMRRTYADALCLDTGATLDDVREAVTTLEDTVRVARRVLGGAHPLTKGIENALQNARAILRAREDA